MLEGKKILFTGGSGLLGGEMKKLIPSALFPERKEFDIFNFSQMGEYLQGKDINLLVHAAAFTSPPRIDGDPIKAINSNIIGTSNVTRLCAEKGIKLIYFSTDYVFDGEKGNYSEEDSVHPVNKYAWSKLGGECAVRLYGNSLIIRTSFGENEFPYEKAFVDQHTSRVNVSKLAKMLKPILEKEDLTGVIHIGGNRKTVMEYAKELNPERNFEKLSIKDVSFNAPKDTSLNCEKYNKLFGENK